ncbi:hypothetical protein [Massilia endophytica]|uniref:hypothetical protein n=1 Tax=Massilia endophytica TaxID=2899220 RepID=UPI001E3881ED|nr:hypothetical protein [Massilia endophytica]UGQ48629.1 hypothetical protein LSQ66_09265 [Massilia endophytica]
MAVQKNSENVQDKDHHRKERAQFKTLLAGNLNYFGNLPQSTETPVTKIVSNTVFEQLTCVAYNPATSFLEATIAIKQASGYGGDLCSKGSTEFVRFFVDYGSGWEDAGLAAVNVHDIPTNRDCAQDLDKPLVYAVNLRLDPKTRCCDKPVLPKVHAILSWQWEPPAGAANVGWTPVWGNTLDCNIQIKPHPWNLFCLFESINESLNQKIKIPQLFEQVQHLPIPQPDPPPFSIGQLAQIYGKGAKGAAPQASTLSVPGHRFGFQALQSIVANGIFSSDVLNEAKTEWKAAGLDLSASIAALAQTNANVDYEQLECLGLDEGIPERLVATFRIKRPSGYSGDLCHPGSQEYVAFWADWDNTCQWTYVGTAQVNVHDIASIPQHGLCYAAILPVDISKFKRGCKTPRVARLRAVLSWNTPPSVTDPDALPTWGNRLDTHVQLNPAEHGTPQAPEIRNIGGIPVEMIDTAGSGLTTSTAVFAHYPGSAADALGRACPFGGALYMDAQFYPGMYYRVSVRKSSDHSVVNVLSDSFLVERWVHPPTFDTQVATNGFFAYLNPADYVTRTVAIWSSASLTGADRDALWEMQLEVSTTQDETGIIGSTPWYRVQLDNTGPAEPPASPPTIDLHISAGGDCKTFPQNSTITGNFIAEDTYFGSWGLSTLPNSAMTPSNQPEAVPFLAHTTPTGPGGHGWSLNTLSPIEMHTCGYVVRLVVHDRSIVNSLPGHHNSNHIEVGLCLGPK